MLAAANDRVTFSTHANAQLDLLRASERREVLSQLRSVEFDHLCNATTDKRGNHKIIVGRFTVVYRIHNGDLNVITLYARE